MQKQKCSGGYHTPSVFCKAALSTGQETVLPYFPANYEFLGQLYLRNRVGKL